MKYLKKFINEYTRFSKSDRHAIIILATLIVLTITATILIPLFVAKPQFDYSEYTEEISQLKRSDINQGNGNKLFLFNPNTISSEELDSLQLPINVKRNIISYRKAGGVFKSNRDVRRIYGMNDSIFGVISAYILIASPKDSIENLNSDERNEQIVSEGFFDPNISDYNQLTGFGFSQYQAKNLIAYRNKGGVFKLPADILKIYGIDSALFLKVKSKIRIETSVMTASSPPQEPLLFIELNEADSTDLLELSGVGPSFAGRILKYRERLGGFYHPSQILEVYNFSEETYAKIEGSIFVDTLKIKKIRINFADFKDIIKHPYFKKEKVNMILKHREKNGPFKDMNEILNSGIFDKIEFEKVEPYLTCR